MMESSCIEVSAAALRRNFAVLRAAAEHAGERPEMLAVLKADAYGHGAAVCAPVVAHAGAAWLGVKDVAEGMLVRGGVRVAALPEPEILIMCGMEPTSAGEAMRASLQHRLTPVVWTAEQVEAAGRAGRDSGERVTVHVEIDTGMARQGVWPGEELEAVLRVLERWREAVQVGGVMTHFAFAEIAGASGTTRQKERFGTALEQLQQARTAGRVREAETLWLHAGNTSTVDEGALLPWLHERARVMGAQLVVRTGLGLFGYALALEGKAVEPRVRRGLQPVATWYTRIVAVRDLQAGEAVGYTGTFVAQRAMRLALLPVGYADGFRRELSGTNDRGGGEVLVRGRRAPVVGRVSMNLTTVDVTDVSGVVAGERVTLLGPAPGPTAEEHARWADTIAYEVLCGMRGERVLADAPDGAAPCGGEDASLR